MSFRQAISEKPSVQGFEMIAVATVLPAMGGLKVTYKQMAGQLKLVATVLPAMGGLKGFVVIAHHKNKKRCNRPPSNGRVERQ
ncbi:MAG: hypothetical protein RMZ41_017550 [Nostoc sp. DedVER02]|uniref:hypothetical protein n=1 Tax=unclassified Nostoc TaxID=2593658 RepID=UPI00391D712D